MRLLRRTGSEGPAELLHAARAGDAAALAVLRADLPPRTLAALRRLLPAAGPTPRAVVAAAREAAASGSAALGGVVDLLMAGDVRTAAAVGELLGLSEAQVLDRSDRRAGCSGWTLLTGGAGLTDPEREAGRVHATRCRACAAVLDGEPPVPPAVPLPAASSPAASSPAASSPAASSGAASSPAASSPATSVVPAPRSPTG